jgi:hypothetical protein
MMMQSSILWLKTARASQVSPLIKGLAKARNALLLEDLNA